jgi:hypothetical protein
MDALILRAALALCLPVSAVTRMQATDVLALSVAAAERETARSHARTLATIETGYVMNAAILAPENLAKLEREARTRAGIVAPLNASASEAIFAAMPLQETA